MSTKIYQRLDDVVTAADILVAERNHLRAALASARDGFEYLQAMIENGIEVEGDADRFTTHRMSGVYAMVYAQIVQDASLSREALAEEWRLKD